jgi:small subunit ribosomal protein S17
MAETDETIADETEEPAPAEPAAEAEEPAAEQPAEEAAAAEEAEPAPAPARKTKAAPRAKAPAPKKEAKAAKAAKPARKKAGERKPIVRLPKPEHARGRRKEQRGVVVSSAMDKTIVVRVDTVKPHPRYKKVVRRSKRFHAHDADNVAKVGDVVRIVESRPLSSLKRWRLAEVLEEAK